MGDVIARATFDPEAALDDPDLVALDIGHPLVRRLIEEVKQTAFRARGDAREYGHSLWFPHTSRLSNTQEGDYLV